MNKQQVIDWIEGINTPTVFTDELRETIINEISEIDKL